MRFRTFSNRLSFAVTGFVALLLITIIAMCYVFASNLLNKQVEEKVQNALKENNGKVEKILTEIESSVEAMVWVVKERQKNPESLYEVTRRLVETSPAIYGSAIAFEPNYYPKKGKYFSPYSYRQGNNIVSKQLGSDSYQYHYMDWYQIPKLMGFDYWIDPYYDIEGGEALMATYSLPIKDDKGNVYAVITADISTDWLTERINKMKVFENSYNMMIGSEAGFIVPHKPKYRTHTYFTSLAYLPDSMALVEAGYKMLSGQSGMVKFKEDGRRKRMYFASLPTTNWSTAMICDEKEILHENYVFFNKIFLITFLGLIALGLLTWFIIKHFTRAIPKFAEAAKSISGGNFHTELPLVDTNDEMKDLRDSIDNMQQSLAQYVDDLKKATATTERVESELRIAHDIQMGMIPKIFPPFPERNDVDIFAKLIPAKEVGGDLYDFFIHNEKLYFVIGDVAGKGVPASLVMAVTRSIFRTIAASHTDPKDIVRHINNAIAKDNNNNMFVTLFLGRLDLKNGELEFCNAGHNPPILVGHTPGQASYMDVLPNLPIGTMEDVDFEKQHIKLESGTTLFMYTDGLTEAENINKVLYGEERILELLKDTASDSSEEIIKKTLADVHRHVLDAEQSDDLTLLVIKYTASDDKAPKGSKSTKTAKDTKAAGSKSTKAGTKAAGSGAKTGTKTTKGKEDKA